MALPSTDGGGECRLFEGEWVREPDGKSSLTYTNGSCVTIPDSKNCFKHGRVDTEFLHWRWKPNGCELPRFDPRKFLRIVRGKTMGFIGDSVSRNHVDSLLCLLSKVVRSFGVRRYEKIACYRGGTMYSTLGKWLEGLQGKFAISKDLNKLLQKLGALSWYSDEGGAIQANMDVRDTKYFKGILWIDAT
ncbi:protein altered xyloglucan 4-like protein [Tanacetum coccineum]|uniref:Protein altered xyloglucan 4-like protein n=1 Tax=Tanacetum coccineum TaxID=301880 RepID=A0ABQ5FKP7_9ASTR